MRNLRTNLILLAIVVFVLPIAAFALNKLLPIIVGLAFIVGAFCVMFRQR